MKRVCTCLLLAFLAAPGCMNLPFGGTHAPKDAAPAPKPAPPSVMPEEVTSDNAHLKADALSKELNHDASGIDTMPTPAGAAKP